MGPGTAARSTRMSISGTDGSVKQHYGVGGILDAILRALADEGKDLDALEPADLAPVDEFHVRGREATVELAGRARLGPGMRVLDLGCGLGGSARHLAAQHGCDVVGIDVTDEYVRVADALSRRVGLADRIGFRLGSALDLPFAEGAFDAVWTEHVQMNVGDKETFYGEAARVLKPGGVLIFHDIFRGAGGEPHYPVPWAQDASISSLASPDEIRATLERAGLRVRDWEDVTRRSLEWFVRRRAQQGSGPPPLGIHLLMGASAEQKLANMVANLREARVAVVQAVAEKG